MNQRMYGLGSRRSVIREIFEFGKKRAQEVGAENVYDFSLGNPSVNPPQIVTDTLEQLLREEDPTALHGYTSAQGDALRACGDRRLYPQDARRRGGCRLYLHDLRGGGFSHHFPLCHLRPPETRSSLSLPILPSTRYLPKRQGRRSSRSTPTRIPSRSI